MRFNVYNHNGTLLGGFKTYKRAAKELDFYRKQTGNEGHIVDVALVNYARIVKQHFQGVKP